MGIRSFIKGKARDVVRRVGAGGSGSSNGNREPGGGLPAQPDAQGFRAVATVGQVREGAGCTYQVDGQPVAVFRVAGQVYAVDDECCHENGPLGEGTLDGPVVTCPYHNWRYDVRSGDCLTTPERNVGCFAVKEKDGIVWVGRRTREASRERGGEHDDGLVTPVIKV